MNELDQILAFANYQTTIKQQRELLAIKFHDECVFAHNGGLFDVTPEFLAGLEVRAKYSRGPNVVGPVSLWVVDRNNSSVLINDVEKFITDATTLYNAAAESYGKDWQTLRTKRNATAIIK